MVLKKRQEYGFRGYQVPVIPRGPRSLRRRGSKRKLVDDGQLCAFELLAAVAGKLLQEESESSASSNAAEGKERLGIQKDVIKKEHIEEKVVKSECLDQGSCIESLLVPESTALQCGLNSTLKKPSRFQNDSAFKPASGITSSDLLKKVGCDVKFEKLATNHVAGGVFTKPEGIFHGDGKLYDAKFGDEAGRQIGLVGGKQSEQHLNVSNIKGSNDPMELYVNNTHMLINSEISVKSPMYRDNIPSAPFVRCRNDVKIVNRDDDENFFRYNQLNTKMRANRPQSRVGYRRIKKLVTSRYWKAAPQLKDYDNICRGGRPFYHKRKTLNARERYQQEIHSKRRRLFAQSSKIAYGQQASSESISHSPEKAVKGDTGGAPAILHRATAVSSLGIGHKASVQSTDPRVKLSIKSFKVPELYIEVPETATVGSLKRTVMEAVTAILGGGLRVGVVLQGKKVRDDSRTLQQTGISQNEDLDTLGFTLEPNFVQSASPLSHKDPPLLLPCDKHEQLSRSPVINLDSGVSNSSFDQVPVSNLDNHCESRREIIPFLTEISPERKMPDSKALVAIPPLNVDSLPIVPMNQKAKRSDLSHRRTRRPFSVLEVEALVEAVEKLGTGRWRDVKMRAFDDANHRTYVDLKDKWKTLVHTASITPQQRRGEPVPQELLDRVLAAHGYWSQHQTKQHGKHQSEHLKLTGEIAV